MTPSVLEKQSKLFILLLLLVSFSGMGGAVWAQEMAGATVDSSGCADCHPTSKNGGAFSDELAKSAHADVGCLDCHVGRDVVDLEKDPVHQMAQPGVKAGDGGCRQCHVAESEQYTWHGRYGVGTTEDLPTCTSCHGDHGILPSEEPQSKTHPSSLPGTCGKCHEDLNLTTKYEMLFDKAVEVYQSSVHGEATQGGVYLAATCNDCHSTGGTAHRILSPVDPSSSINHFNIPKTCGRCHRGVESDYWEGIHGRLVQRGETDAPVCTHCHGEHGIISHDDPRSPVSRARVAQATCSPCHESAVLNEKYGLPRDRLATFIDSYHGLKTKAGDPTVANCASCHGVHRILPSTDPTSTVHAKNLRKTCGECHPGITEALASTPIHGVGGQGLRAPAADIVESIYIVAIIVIVGLMVLHWLLDIYRHVRDLFRARPQVRRMRTHEVWQHSLLMVSFIVLVISGFALRYSDGWLSRFFFGWRGGFELRGTVHRVAAVLFMGTVFWHCLFLLTRRGRQFLLDMMPQRRDFTQFWEKLLYNLGRRSEQPSFGRFSYVEKAEYWALVWGTAVMALTGVMLWFDNWVIQYVPKGVLDVALVVHFWEAWLASLAILVWHMYSTIFSPHVYPMNPSWITGSMPESMYRHEHPEHVAAARRETEQLLEQQLEMLSPPLEAEPVNGRPEPQEESDAKWKESEVSRDVRSSR